MQLAQQLGASWIDVSDSDPSEIVALIEHIHRCPVGHPRHDQFGKLAQGLLDVE